MQPAVVAAAAAAAWKKRHRALNPEKAKFEIHIQPKNPHTWNRCVCVYRTCTARFPQTCILFLSLKLMRFLPRWMYSVRNLPHLCCLAFLARCNRLYNHDVFYSSVQMLCFNTNFAMLTIVCVLSFRFLLNKIPNSNTVNVLYEIFTKDAWFTILDMGNVQAYKCPTL